MGKVRDKLQDGDFNTMNQEEQPNGSIVVKLIKRGDSHIYMMKVKDLYGEHEEVLKEEIIETKPPKHILDRMKEAKKHNG